MKARGFFLLLLALIAGGSPQAQAADCAAPGEHSLSMRHGVLEREYTLYVPASAPAQKRGLVVGLHGGWGSGAIFAEQAQLKQAADRSGLLLLLPEGKYKSWNAGSCCGPSAKYGVDDVGFVRRVVETVQQKQCVDQAKVYGTGFSNGAMLLHRIRCAHPQLFTAIAPVAGGPMIQDCAAQSAMPALLIQGRNDPRIFWDGGEFDGSYRPSMASVVQRLAGNNACAGEAGQAKADGLGCAQLSCTKAPLRWCGVPGVGHQWPGGKTYWEDKLGANRQDVDATRMIYDFFLSLQD